jgi:hypothetical protein
MSAETDDSDIDDAILDVDLSSGETHTDTRPP